MSVDDEYDRGYKQAYKDNMDYIAKLEQKVASLSGLLEAKERVEKASPIQQV